MFIESFGDDAFIDRAYDLLFNLAIFDDEKSWNAANVEFGSCRAVCVDIEFTYFNPAFVFLCDSINGGCDRAA